VKEIALLVVLIVSSRELLVKANFVYDLNIFCLFLETPVIDDERNSSMAQAASKSFRQASISLGNDHGIWEPNPTINLSEYRKFLIYIKVYNLLQSIY
jgi:hypothetical protein